MRKLILFLVVLAFGFAESTQAKSLTKPYRLGVVIVVDQLRADQLTQYQRDFMAPQKDGGGFRFLMDGGVVDTLHSATTSC